MTASQERPRGSIRRFSAATDFRRLAASSLAGLGALMLAGAAPPPLAFRIDEVITVCDREWRLTVKGVLILVLISVSIWGAIILAFSRNL